MACRVSTKGRSGSRDLDRSAPIKIAYLNATKNSRRLDRRDSFIQPLNPTGHEILLAIEAEFECSE
jgi:hypothetical protein